MEYDQELKQFFDAMRYKLGVNKHKGKWENLDLEKAFDLLRGEVEELEEAMANENMVETLLEAADVANFAMIVANIAIKKAAGEQR